MSDSMKTSADSRQLDLFPTLASFPDIIVGSPPCQDISSANAKGRDMTVSGRDSTSKPSA